MNNHIIINNNNFPLNEQNNLNKGFILNNIDIFRFNNYNNNLKNIDNNNDNRNNNLALPLNDNALNINYIIIWIN